MCEETLTKLKFLTDEIEKVHIKLQKPEDLDQFNTCLSKLCKSEATSEQVIFDQICKDGIEKTDFVKQQKTHVQSMQAWVTQMELFQTALLTVS